MALNHGEVREGWYCKKLKKSKHLHKKTNSWAIEEQDYKYMLEKGMQGVKVIDTDTNDKYKATLEQFTVHGIVLQFGHYDEQRFLPLKYWEIWKNSQQSSNQSNKE